MRIGILAIQGGYFAHAQMLQRLSIEYLYITTPAQLTGINGLIIPGGESTTLLKFLSQNNFAEAIQQFVEAGHFVFGTCAGAILLAKTVSNPLQSSLALIDMSIERNAYGRQLSSRIGKGLYLLPQKEISIDMIFIRAPRIIRVGPSLNVFATYEGEPVGLANSNCMVTAFHPELTQDVSIHRLFIDKIEGI